MNIQEFLARRNIAFQLLEHDETFDAQHMAQAIHVSGHHVAKTVLLRADGEVSGTPNRYLSGDVAVAPTRRQRF